MRTQVFLSLTVAALSLAACSPPVPDSAQGVGFSDYNSYLREQAASGARQPVAPVAQAPAGFSPEAAAAAIDRATGLPDPNQPVFGNGAAGFEPVNTPLTTTPLATYPQAGAGQTLDPATLDPATLDPNRPRGDAPSNIKVESGEMVHNNTGISDEQDFSAVSSRETIESDKERLARNRAQYQVVQPTAVPQRTETGPNIVEFALATTHAPGTQMYSRSALRLTDPMVACARFASPDLAQQAFLEAGGPKRDRKGLDPDGDGFACSWDPRPFRQ